jgi:hypothetical protein
MNRIAFRRRFDAACWTLSILAMAAVPVYAFCFDAREGTPEARAEAARDAALAQDNPYALPYEEWVLTATGKYAVQKGVTKEKYAAMKARFERFYAERERTGVAERDRPAPFTAEEEEWYRAQRGGRPPHESLGDRWDRRERLREERFPIRFAQGGPNPAP